LFIYSLIILTFSLLRISLVNL